MISQARSMSHVSSTGCSLVVLILIAAFGRFQHLAVCALQDGSHNPSPEPINPFRCKPRETPPWLKDPSKVARILSGPPCFVVEASRRRESHARTPRIGVCVALSIVASLPECPQFRLPACSSTCLHGLLQKALLHKLGRQVLDVFLID